MKNYNNKNLIPYRTLRRLAKVIKEYYPNLSMRKCMKIMLKIYSKYGLCFKFQILFGEIILITGYYLSDNTLLDKFVETDYVRINKFF